MAEHRHTPELRLRKDYNAGVIPANCWVCAECEVFLGWSAADVDRILEGEQ